LDFTYSEDQRAIQELAESIFGDHCTDAYQASRDQSSDSFDQKLWSTLCEAGLPSLLISESAGGSGLGMTDLSVVLQAQGRFLAPVPLGEHAIGVRLLERAGLLTQDYASGQQLVGLALDDLLDARAGRLELRRDSSGQSFLNGFTEAVAFGDACGALIMAAREGGQSQLVLLDHQALRQAERHVGRSQHHQGVADLRFKDSPVTVLRELSVDLALEHALAMLSALTLGVLQEQVRRAVSYTAERVQFGRAIGTFQAVQMRMADAQIDLEVLKTSLMQLVYRLDAGLPSSPQASATKFLASEAGHRVGHGAQHVHGGIGVDQSYPIHRYLFWARALSMRLGGSGAHLERLGSWLDQSDRLGWKYNMMEDVRAT